MLEKSPKSRSWTKPKQSRVYRLLEAAYQGSENIIRLLLRSHPDVEQQDSTAIHPYY